MSDLSEKPTSVYLGREEIRGLFALGLLAIVVSIRIQYQDKEITVPINGMNYVVTPFFDAMILLWSFYAFFMVMGISDDIIGEKASSIFRSISRYYLYSSFVILGLMGVAFYYSINPLRAIGVSVIVIALLIYWFARQIYLLKKRMHEKGLSIKSLLQKSFNYLKSEWYQFLASVFFVCLMLVVFGTHDEFIIPSSIIGSIFLILFLVIKERRKRPKRENLSGKCH
jgi:Flp pilus assembly protein TadB